MTVLAYDPVPEVVDRPPLTVAIDGVDHPIAWSGRTRSDAKSCVVKRVRERTLAGAARARSDLRAEVADPENLVVALEVEALIAADAPTARATALRAAHDACDHDTVRYIGTPYGLLTLILDVYAAHVADAVVIRPIDGSPTATLIADQVIPHLR